VVHLNKVDFLEEPVAVVLVELAVAVQMERPIQVGVVVAKAQ
jgi:hypothetical protein